MKKKLTIEERNLLLSDLSARLPYGVFCQIDGLHEPKKLIRIEVDEVDGVLLDFENKGSLPIQVYLSEVKPYLRRSTTEEELALIRVSSFITRTQNFAPAIDFINSGHLDYRGLIDQGIALEAHREMYNL